MLLIANHMLNHVPNLASALSEIQRVLQPEGRLYATTVGLNHMAELTEVPRKLGSKHQIAVIRRSPSSTSTMVPGGWHSGSPESRSNARKMPWS